MPPTRCQHALHHALQHVPPRHATRHGPLQVGFYQIAKLLMSPFVAAVEMLWLKKRFPPAVLACIVVVLAGVGIVTVRWGCKGGRVGGAGGACGGGQRPKGRTAGRLVAGRARTQGGAGGAWRMTVSGPRRNLVIQESRSECVGRRDTEACIGHGVLVVCGCELPASMCRCFQMRTGVYKPRLHAPRPGSPTPLPHTRAHNVYPNLHGIGARPFTSKCPGTRCSGSAPLPKVRNPSPLLRHTPLYQSLEPLPRAPRSRSDVSVQLPGLVMAGLFIVSGGLQQILCGHMQATLKIQSHQLMSNTSFLQVRQACVRACG